MCDWEEQKLPKCYGLHVCNFHGKTGTAERINSNDLLRNSLNKVLWQHGDIIIIILRQGHSVNGGAYWIKGST